MTIFGVISNPTVMRRNCLVGVAKNPCRLQWERTDQIFSLRGKNYTEVRLRQSEINFLLKENNVTAVDLSENKLTELNMGLFIYFPMVDSLTKLELSQNELEYIPADLDTLKNLRYLNLYSNNIRSLVPCIANLKHLIWINLNRNPINSLSSSFRKIAGSMQTDEECREAAHAIVAWMQETVQLNSGDFLDSNQHRSPSSPLNRAQSIKELKFGYANSNSNRGLLDKDNFVRRRMRNLASMSNSSKYVCNLQNGQDFAGCISNSQSRFKVVRPSDSPPFLVEDEEFNSPLRLENALSMSAGNGRGKGKRIRFYFLLPIFLLFLAALVISEETFDRLTCNCLFFFPRFIRQLIISCHSGVQNCFRYFFNDLSLQDTQIFPKVASEYLVKFLYGVVALVLKFLQYSLNFGRVAET